MIGTIRRSCRRLLPALLLVVALVGGPGIGLVVQALQTGEVFSPASGHAEVIAQGVAPLPTQATWRAVFHSVAPGTTAALSPGGPGFVLVDTGGILLTAGHATALISPGEASFHDDATVRAVPVGERSAGIFAIDLVPPEAAEDAGDGIPVYASAPFDAPGGARDIDLVRDLLEPGESTTVIGNAAPVLVLVTLGSIKIEATDGSTATLKVGEAATFSGDIVLTAEGQAPSTFVAAVVGREAPLANGTPGATPTPITNGVVQVTVYACPPVVTAAEASSMNCLRDPEAVSLRLAAIEGGTLRDVGPATERQGLPAWTGLRGGDYLLQATEFRPGFGRFVVPGVPGIDDRGAAGYGMAATGGYRISIGADEPERALDVFVLEAAGGATPEARASAETPLVVTAPAAATGTPAAGRPARPTEIPSVIQIETAVPGSSPTPAPRARATSTPRPAAIATARPTERPLVTSTAVARPRRGSVDVRVWGCPSSIDAFNPANCSQAVGGFEVRLVASNGEVVSQADATIGSDGTVSWANLPLGTYLFQQPTMLPGAATYYAPDLQLADNGAGYLVTISADSPVAAFDVYNLPPAAAPPTPTAAPLPADTDGDGLTDADETGVYGTNPTLADSDGDGILDGAEVAAGTNPLIVDAAAAQAPTGGDSDGDHLLDADEPAYGTNPNNPDSDGDGWLDGDEVSLGTNPLDASSFPVG